MPAFQRTCDRCGTDYQARRSTSRYCSASCRSAAARQRHAQTPPEPAPAPPGQPAEQSPRTQVEQMVRNQLLERGCLDTVDGQSAVALAIQVDERAPGRSALITSLRATLQLALDGHQPPAEDGADDGAAPDPIIQLEERREQRRRRTAR